MAWVGIADMAGCISSLLKLTGLFLQFPDQRAFGLGFKATGRKAKRPFRC